MDNYYKILGVKDFATDEEIKMGYRKLSKKFHPDLNDGDEFFTEKFKELQLAYEVLSEPTKKSNYDEKLKMSMTNTPAMNQKTSEEQKRPSSTPNMSRPSPYVYNPKSGRFSKRRRF